MRFEVIIPTLSTPRLTLRPHRLEDFAFYAQMWREPEVARHITVGGMPRTEEEAWASFLRLAGQWQMVGFGFWAVEEKAGGKLVGELGFIERKRDWGFKDMPEMGWAFATSATGKGYATEAVSAAIAWGAAHFGHIRVIAVTAPQNYASIRVAEKCGFREFQRDLSGGHPSVIFDRVL
jgi:RimJ/RimL family protein N-acetyltransferase